MADEIDVMTASEDLILSCTMAQIREVAKGIGVRVSGKTRTQLVEEIIAAREELKASGEVAQPSDEELEAPSEELEAPEAIEEELPPQTQPDVALAGSGPVSVVTDPVPDESFDSDDDEITHEEARMFDGATDADIQDWLTRRAHEARMCLVAYAYTVLDRRYKARKEAAEKAALESQVEQFEVTKGGRIGVGGFWTNLPIGSVVARHTHDLDNLVQQGIEFRPVRRVSVESDNIGVIRTRIEL